MTKAHREAIYNCIIFATGYITTEDEPLLYEILEIVKEKVLSFEDDNV